MLQELSDIAGVVRRSRALREEVHEDEVQTARLQLTYRVDVRKLLRRYRPRSIWQARPQMQPFSPNLCLRLDLWRR